MTFQPYEALAANPGSASALVRSLFLLSSSSIVVDAIDDPKGKVGSPVCALHVLGGVFAPQCVYVPALTLLLPSSGRPLSAMLSSWRCRKLDGC